MSIAVTGALGFIGSAIVKELNNRELGDITLVDYPADDKGKWKNLKGLVFTDFVSPSEFDPCDYELVFHLGADSSTGITFDQAVQDFKYSQYLFEACAEAGTRILYASSAGTYGTDAPHFNDEEIYDLCPQSPYAMGKQMLDMYVVENGFDNIFGLKYSNVFGPGEYHKGKMASMVYQWYKMIRGGDETPLFQPDDEFARDFIYVQDAARMTVDLGFCEEELQGVYNMGCGEATLFRDVLIMLYDILDEEPRINKIPMPERLAEQYQPYTCLNMDKTRGVIDFHTMDVQSAIFDYVGCLEEDLRIGEK